MSGTDKIVVLITAPSEEEAVKIATALVDDKLAACVNIIPGLRSIYRWEGNICDDREVLMVAKTRRSVFDRLKERVRSLHPYTTPEIIAIPVTAGFEDYLAWVDEKVV
ncbi:MAG: divalent-cation tolerance protein CutA [Nitrospinae bacterium]|nr:divalent-cation tolerance protein CutA [Nitrospinota bacterium]